MYVGIAGIYLRKCIFTCMCRQALFIEPRTTPKMSESIVNSSSGRRVVVVVFSIVIAVVIVSAAVVAAVIMQQKCVLPCCHVRFQRFANPDKTRAVWAS